MSQSEEHRPPGYEHMAELQQCEFFLLRYAADAVREEFVNIGVILLQERAAAGPFAGVRFTRDWRRVRCVDPAADIEMLEAVEAEIEERLREGGQDRERILHLLRDSFSNTLQLSPVKGCLTESPEQELGRLAEMYLQSTRRAEPRASAGRGLILGRMRAAFEDAGVWQLMRKKIAAAPFTHPGDPLKLDCGYRPNGVFKFFHAVPLASDIDGAKVLAAASTVQKDLAKDLKGTKNKAAAAAVGKAIAEKAKAAGVESVAFDRSGFRYHGRIAALADAAREAGLKF